MPERERIISADSHVTITQDAVLAHLDPRLHDAYRAAQASFARSMTEAKPHKRGKAAPAPQLPNMGEGAPWAAAGRPGAHDPHARLADMDTDGVDAEVLYSDVSAGAPFYEMGDGYLEAFRAFNSAALDFASVDPKRLLPVYTVPLVDVAEAVREVERIAGEGGRAVQLPLYPRELGLESYWDERYDPLWSALSETGIPISQHVGSNEYLMTLLAEDPTPAKGVFQSLPPVFMAEVVAGWIVPGTLARFPDLKVVLVESGLGWIPYYLERLDTMRVRHGWDRMGMPIDEPPSVYWHRQMAATFEEDRFGIRNRHDIGVENLMWATDYPHPDSTWPRSQEVIHEHFDGVPIEETRQMVAGNAARFYGL